MTTPGTDGVRNYKRANKSKDASSLRQSLQEAIGHSCKVPTAYQIKPKKLKKKTMGWSSSKNKYNVYPMEAKTRKSSKRSGQLTATSHFKSKSFLNGGKASKPPCKYQSDALKYLTPPAKYPI